jgi:hypothetical protein
MMPKSMIKVICVVMAALMILSVVAVLLQVIAVDEAMLLAMPATGDNDSDYLIPAGLGVAALLAIGICVILPKLKKK